MIFRAERGMTVLPLDTMFPSLQPVEIDIGCGKGGFLLARAQAHPEVNLIGIERMLKRVRKVDGKLLRSGLSNVRLLREECMHAVSTMFPSASVQTAYLFFSDPWPKRRHHRRRLVSEPFVDALSSALKSGGHVHVMTDHLEYFEMIRGMFSKHLSYIPVAFPDFPMEERTDFERVFEKEKKPIGRCSFRRSDRSLDVLPVAPPGTATSQPNQS